MSGDREFCKAAQKLVFGLNANNIATI